MLFRCPLLTLLSPTRHRTTHSVKFIFNVFRTKFECCPYQFPSQTPRIYWPCSRLSYQWSSSRRRRPKCFRRSNARPPLLLWEIIIKGGFVVMVTQKPAPCIKFSMQMPNCEISILVYNQHKVRYIILTRQNCAVTVAHLIISTSALERESIKFPLMQWHYLNLIMLLALESGQEQWSPPKLSRSMTQTSVVRAVAWYY